MFAVEGIFDGTAVQLNTAELPVRERCRVVVTFLNPPENNDLAERQAAFQRLV
jgi:hypothetical protein